MCAYVGEHLCALVSPPDLPDAVFSHTLPNKVRDSGMPNQVRGYLLRDSCAGCNDPEPLFECLVPERFLFMLADEDVCITFWYERVVCTAMRRDTVLL